MVRVPDALKSVRQQEQTDARCAEVATQGVRAET